MYSTVSKLGFVRKSWISEGTVENWEKVTASTVRKLGSVH
jgi:hypothetical protein